MNEEFSIFSLKEKPHKYSETLALIEEEFSYDASESFAIDFFPLFNTKNFSNCFILIDNKTDSVIGHLGSSARSIVLNEVCFPILLIGGVCIQSKMQGKGFSSRLLSYALRHEDKYAFTCLWSDKLDYYKKYFFYPCISLYESCVGLKLKESFDLLNFNDLKENDLIAIKKLYNDNPYIKVKRTNEDWLNVFRVTSASLMVQRDNEAKISHYFIKDKGQDLTNVIHEYSSKEIFDFSKNDFVLWSGEKEQGSTPLFATLLRIGNHNLFNSFILEYTNKKVTIENISKDKISFKFAKQDNTDNTDRFLDGVLGPNFYREIDSLKLKNIYFCGIDSI